MADQSKNGGINIEDLLRILADTSIEDKAQAVKQFLVSQKPGAEAGENHFLPALAKRILVSSDDEIRAEIRTALSQFVDQMAKAGGKVRPDLIKKSELNQNQLNRARETAKLWLIGK